MSRSGRSHSGASSRSPAGAGRRFGTALAALTVLVVGVPILLGACSMAALGAAHPLPGIGSSAEIGDYFRRGLSTTELLPIAIRILLIVGWALWIAMTLSIAGAVVESATGSRRGLPDVRIFSGLARWIAAGLTAFSALSANFVSADALPSRLPFTVSAVASADDAARLVTSRGVAPGFARVRPGESAETFAARVLGDASRWPELWELNRDRPVGPSGERWTAAWKLGAGWDLQLPAGSDPPADPDSPEAGDVADRAVVVAGDSYWSLAEDHLGDDAGPAEVAGYVEVLIDANAAELGYHDPAMLQPGDVVTFAPPAASASVMSSAAETGPHTYVVRQGDSYWRIAEQRAVALHGADGASTTVVYDLMLDLIDLNAPRLERDERELLLPGDVVWLFDPALAAAAGTDSLPPPTPSDEAALPDGAEPDPVSTTVATVTVPDVTVPPESLPPVTAPDVTDTSVPADVPAGGADPADAAATPAGSPAPIGVTETVLLATGVVALIAARRRARLRAAEPPARVPLPPASAVAVERSLRRASDADRLLRVDLALRAAAAALAGGTSRVRLVRVAPDGTIELALSAPHELPSPWTGGAGRWTLSAAVAVDELAPAARTVGAPCVAITELGVDEDGWDVLVDLEALGLLAVDAEPAVADDIVRALAVGLASSVFAEVAHLIEIGLGDTALLGHRHGHSAASVDDALELAATLVGSGAAAPGESTFALRARHTGGEAWEPAVVLVAAAPRVAAAEIVPTVGSRGIVVVAGARVAGAPWTLVPESGAGPASWVLQPGGLRLRPVGVTVVELTAVAEAVSVDPAVAVDFAPPAGSAEPDGDEVLPSAPHTLLGPDAATDPHVTVVDLAAADEVALTTVVVTEPPGPSGVNGHVGRNGNGRPSRDDSAGPVTPPIRLERPPRPEWSLLVRMIGPVDVVDASGGAVHFEKSKALELVAWLATHRTRSSRGAARTALWDLDVRDATFANVVSDARRSLARHLAPPPGEEWLPRTLTEELVLHAGVVTDVEVIRADLAYARGRPPHEALALLRPAVELVRGVPFSTTGYLWPDTDGLVSDFVLLATSATAEYGRLALELGDTAAVFWATGLGLAVIAGQETMIGLRMEAHARTGDLAGVRVEWESYERTLTADPWSDGEPAAKLVALRRELLSR